MIYLSSPITIWFLPCKKVSCQNNIVFKEVEVLQKGVQTIDILWTGWKKDKFYQAVPKIYDKDCEFPTNVIAFDEGKHNPLSCVGLPVLLFGCPVANKARTFWHSRHSCKEIKMVPPQIFTGACVYYALILYSFGFVYKCLVIMIISSLSLLTGNFK